MGEMDRVASLYKPGGLVFANETGGIINPSNLRNRSFARVLERAGLPADIRFHDLRHACATLLLSRNVDPKVVSEMLGHANTAITLDTLLVRPPGHAGEGCEGSGGSAAVAGVPKRIFGTRCGGRSGHAKRV